MKFVPSLFLFSAFAHQVLTVSNPGPTTGVTWSLAAGSTAQFTAFSFTVLIPSKLPWTIQGSSVVFQPNLLNSDNSAWYYYDSISYNNNTGTSDVPPYYILDFEPLLSSRDVDSKRTLAGVNVYPSDALSIAYTKTGSVWNQHWSVTRGAAGAAAGTVASSGNFAFTFPADSKFNLIHLSTLFNLAFFDFGAITWSNIRLVASTTSTSWCPPTPVSLYNTGYEGSFPSGLSTVSVSGGATICTLPVMVWGQPAGAAQAEADFIAQIEACKKIIAAGGHCTY